MRKRRFTTSHAWIVLLAGSYGFVAVWDLTCDDGEDLTALGREHPFLVWLVGGTTMGHLLGVLPWWADPFTLLAPLRSLARRSRATAR